MNTNKYTLFILLLSILSSISCNNQQESVEEKQTIINPKEWSKNAIIYEVNIRQYTPEGTINAFVEHLPTLDSLGVDILWVMPIFPCGVKNSKGSMGSAYAVKDYRAVNPDYGSMDDLKNLVNKAHELGMYVILDWVANHSAWDNPLIDEHPEWYSKDSLGNNHSPIPEWSDVVDLNYDNKELRTYMLNSLKFWVEQADVDGFRCDVAMMVPTDFWENTREELDRIKPVFMLAEAEQPDLLINAFDMNYGWELYHIMNNIAQGKMNATDLTIYFNKYDSVYQSNDYRMNFTTNHDENSWNGTVKERMGDASEAMAVFTYMIPGMPLIYSGQETGLDKRLAFFEKDTIQWNNSPLRALYTQLNQLKKTNKALWNGDNGAKMNQIHTNLDDKIFALQREKDNQVVIAFFNMSNESQQFTLKEVETKQLVNYFTGQEISIESNKEYSLAPWQYLILTNQSYEN